MREYEDWNRTVPGDLSDAVEAAVVSTRTACADPLRDLKKSKDSEKKHTPPV